MGGPPLACLGFYFAKNFGVVWGENGLLVGYIRDVMQCDQRGMALSDYGLEKPQLAAISVIEVRRRLRVKQGVLMDLCYRKAGLLSSSICSRWGGAITPN